MTERVKVLYDQLRKRDYRLLRSKEAYEIDSEMISMSPAEKSAHRLIRVLNREQPVLYPNERIGFNRYSAFIPSYDTGSKWHSDWGIGNVTPNYSRIMNAGFDAVLLELAGLHNTRHTVNKFPLLLIGTLALFC